jgi:hypothetical protein
VRATAIEVVCRLEDLRRLGGAGAAAPRYERQVAALEALQIYAPMGHALGMGRLAAELEDACFQVRVVVFVCRGWGPLPCLCSVCGGPTCAPLGQAVARVECALFGHYWEVHAVVTWLPPSLKGPFGILVLPLGQSVVSVLDERHVAFNQETPTNYQLPLCPQPCELHQTPLASLPGNLEGPGECPIFPAIHLPRYCRRCCFPRPMRARRRGCARRAPLGRRHWSAVRLPFRLLCWASRASTPWLRGCRYRAMLMLC